MLLTLLELSMWPRGRLILIMLDTMTLDMLDMEDMLLQWSRLSALFTMLLLFRLLPLFTTLLLLRLSTLFTTLLLFRLLPLFTMLLLSRLFPLFKMLLLFMLLLQSTMLLLSMLLLLSTLLLVSMLWLLLTTSLVFTMDTTMLTPRCPLLPPFPSLEQPLLLCLEWWEPEPMLELVAMLLTLLELSMWPRGRLILIMLDFMAMHPLFTMDTTMLLTLRCPPLPPFPLLE